MDDSRTSLRRQGDNLPLGRRACPVGPRVRANGGVASAYLAMERSGAGPRGLGALQYDALVRSCRQGLAALEADDVQQAAVCLTAAEVDARNLVRSLDQHAVEPRGMQFVDFFEQVHRGLAEARFYRRRQTLRRILLLLEDQRTSWLELACPLDGSVVEVRGESPCNSWVG